MRFAQTNFQENGGLSRTKKSARRKRLSLQRTPWGECPAFPPAVFDVAGASVEARPWPPLRILFKNLLTKRHRPRQE